MTFILFDYLKDLECYANDHLYVDAMDNTDSKYRGPVSQYRQFLVSLKFIFLFV